MAEQLTNDPALWLDVFPRPLFDAHKYDRGHAVVVAAPELTGATRLTAEACSRIGTGLVTVVASKRADIYRTALAADIMVSEDSAAVRRGATAYLLGPGGLPDAWEQIVGVAPPTSVAVLDAAAIREHTHLRELFAHCIVTPHEGEFAQAFPDAAGDREARAVQAATTADAIVVLKGAATLIAAPDGRVVTNTNASPYLAKAGSGDVLAGFITGLAAQGMPAFEAACAAVWMHGELGGRIGPGLVPSDLVDRLPELLSELLQGD
jgi:hydroxyethylthiazole kinase-like uncharacterized protein yjeF